jgi:cation/acetate symporter
LTAPAYAAFAELAILKDVIGAAADGLPAWMFTFGRLGLVKVCGVDAVSVAAVKEACRAGGRLLASDVAVGADAIVLAWPEIVGLPHVTSVLLAVGALAAVLAAAGAIAFAIGSALGHDLYARLIGVRASAGRHLAVTRLLLIAVVVVGAWLAANRADDAFALALAAISLSAGGLFPALFAAVWWRRANASGAVAGMAAGFAATAAIVVAYRYPGLLPLGPFEPYRLGLSELSAAIVGLPVGFVAIVAVSLVTPRPSEERQSVLDAIRRPGGQPFVQEGES